MLGRPRLVDRRRDVLDRCFFVLVVVAVIFLAAAAAVVVVTVASLSSSGELDRGVADVLWATTLRRFGGGSGRGVAAAEEPRSDIFRVMFGFEGMSI